MTSNYLHSIMTELAAAKPIFTNEAEFQLNLGVRLGLKGYDIGLERKRTITVNGHQLEIWVDIIATLGGVRTGIELKYVARAANIIHNGEHYQFTNNWGTNMSRFSILKDLSRVDRLVAEGQVEHGYSVSIVNVSETWERNTLDENIKGAAFSLHQGRDLTVGARLDWSVPMAEGSVGIGGLPPNVPFVIAKTQTIQWRDYSAFDSAPNGQFRYLILQG